MPRRFLLRLLPLVALLVVALVGSREAHAGRGIMLITSGDAIVKVADLGPDVKAAIDEEMGPGIAVGYKYEQFGLFFLEMWTWDGQYVLFRDDDYWDASEEEIAGLAGVSAVGDLGKPWQYRFPLGLLIVVGLVGAFVLFKVLTRGKGEDAPVDPALG